MEFSEIGLKVPRILLPKEGIDMSKWSVVACDQYTSEPEYWEKVKEYVGDAPSTLNLVFPEVYLESRDESMISFINNNMKKYFDEGVFIEKEGFILIDRKTSHAGSRKGLVVAIDLEKYDYTKGSKSLIRATEGTIVERLPPRIKVRENAVIELPHIMVLIDDPNKTVIEPLFDEKLECIYDFELMMDGGHIKGYMIEETDKINQIADSLSKLMKDRMLYAMGDGNHSLATAKAVWEKKKEQGADMGSAARYALVELVNVHDPGLIFEPIHRVVFDVDIDDILKKMEEFFNEQGSELSLNAQDSDESSHAIEFISKSKSGTIVIKNPKLNLEVGSLQAFIDHSGLKVDYIHGTDSVIKLANKGNIGFLLPAMPKSELFPTVIKDGALPRKTFSMGEAAEKRFYIEARRID